MMLKHSGLLHSWATVLLVFAVLTLVAGVIGGIVSIVHRDGVAWWYSVGIAAGCLPWFILSAICRGLALLLQAQDETTRQVRAARDRQIQDEMNDQLANEVRALHRDRR